MTYVLRPVDFTSPLWRGLAAEWAQKREILRDRISQPGIPEREADHLRGRIEELSFNLSLPEQYARAEDRADTIEPGDVAQVY